MKWTHQYDPSEPRVEMEVHMDSTLSEVLIAFETFLKAIGYHIDGHLEIVNEEKKKEI